MIIQYKLILFDEVEINVDLFNAYNYGEKVQVEYRIDILQPVSKIIYLINDENSPSYQEYKSYIRDKNIDKIINI